MNTTTEENIMYYIYRKDVSGREYTVDGPFAKEADAEYECEIWNISLDGHYVGS